MAPLRALPPALLLCVLLGVLTGCEGGGPMIPPYGFGPDTGEVAVGDDWRWLPVDGTKCALGARSGLALQRGGNGHDVFVYVQGGGACWNEGTCAPSYRTNGPICYYNPNAFCLIDQPGGAQPTSSHVDVPNPFPAEGGSLLEQELSVISASAMLDRELPGNPFREASFVYIPYCTGDLHAGRSTRTYRTQEGPFSPVRERTHHFAGADNMERSIEVLKERFPFASRIWLFGISAGGYGATLHHARFQAAFPDAEVHLLADSAPFIQPRHWEDWVSEWNMVLPEDCTACREGLPQVMDRVLSTSDSATARVALLAYRRDATVGWFFLADKGAEPFLNPTPTLDAYEARLHPLLSRYEEAPASRFFVLPGEQHVMLQGYGHRQQDGTYSAPFASPDGTTDLRRWIDAWATGPLPPDVE